MRQLSSALTTSICRGWAEGSDQPQNAGNAATLFRRALKEDPRYALAPGLGTKLSPEILQHEAEAMH